jgi:hypothetical protein
VTSLLSSNNTVFIFFPSFRPLTQAVTRLELHRYPAQHHCLQLILVARIKGPLYGTRHFWDGSNLSSAKCWLRRKEQVGECLQKLCVTNLLTHLHLSKVSAGQRAKFSSAQLREQGYYTDSIAVLNEEQCSSAARAVVKTGL